MPVRVPSSPEREVGTKIPLCVPPQVWVYLDALDVRFADINEGNRPLFASFGAFFNPSHHRGQNHQICDCSQTRHAIVLPFCNLNYVCISDGFASSIFFHVNFPCLGRCKHVCISFLLPPAVRLFLSFETLPTCLTHRPLLIKLAIILATSLDVAQQYFLCCRAGLPLICSHFFRLTLDALKLQQCSNLYGLQLSFTRSRRVPLALSTFFTKHTFLSLVFLFKYFVSI